MGKTYEISCTIDKTGLTSEGVKTEGERDDEDELEGKTGTTFEMTTTFAGVRTNNSVTDFRFLHNFEYLTNHSI